MTNIGDRGVVNNVNDGSGPYEAVMGVFIVIIGVKKDLVVSEEEVSAEGNKKPNFLVGGHGFPTEEMSRIAGGIETQ